MASIIAENCNQGIFDKKISIITYAWMLLLFVKDCYKSANRKTIYFSHKRFWNSIILNKPTEKYISKTFVFTSFISMLTNSKKLKSNNKYYFIVRSFLNLKGIWVVAMTFGSNLSTHFRLIRRFIEDGSVRNWWNLCFFPRINLNNIPSLLIGMIESKSLKITAKHFITNARQLIRVNLVQKMCNINDIDPFHRCECNLTNISQSIGIHFVWEVHLSIRDPLLSFLSNRWQLFNNNNRSKCVLPLCMLYRLPIASLHFFQLSPSLLTLPLRSISIVSMFFFIVTHNFRNECRNVLSTE